MTTNNLQVPEGWIKKEPLVISKRNKSGKNVWVAEAERAVLRISDDNSNPDTIDIKLFNSFDELTEFLNWWYS